MAASERASRTAAPNPRKARAFMGVATPSPAQTTVRLGRPLAETAALAHGSAFPVASIDSTICAYSDSLALQWEIVFP
jgi:hypothetical protein